MIHNRKVAVAVPCLNEERQGGDVLASLQSEVYVALVIDDASTDGIAHQVALAA